MARQKVSQEDVDQTQENEDNGPVERVLKGDEDQKITGPDIELAEMMEEGAHQIEQETPGTERIERVPVPETGEEKTPGLGLSYDQLGAGEYIDRLFLEEADLIPGFEFSDPQKRYTVSRLDGSISDGEAELTYLVDLDITNGLNPPVVENYLEEETGENVETELTFNENAEFAVKITYDAESKDQVEIGTRQAIGIIDKLEDSYSGL